MSQHAVSFLAVFLVLGLPMGFLVWPWGLRKPGSRVWVQMLLSIWAVWFSVALLYFLTLPGFVREAQDRGNLGYDGVGGGAGVMMFGWIFGLVGLIPATFVRAAVEGVRLWRKRGQAEVEE